MDKSQRVSGHRRRVNGKKVRVRSHTRRAQWARAKSTWIGAGFSAIVMLGILFEAGITLVSTLLLLLIAVLGGLSVLASRSIENNRKALHGSPKRRAGRSRSSRRRSQSSRKRTSSKPRSGARRRTTSANRRRGR